MEIIIAGGGLTGLSCSYELQKSGINTKIIDFRQEIGSPTRSPGIIRDNEFWEMWCKDFNLYSQCNFYNNENGLSGIRREWLEKNIAIELGKNGTIIYPKRKIDHINYRNKFEIITNINSKRSNKIFNCDVVIDALGNKKQNATWSCNPKIISQKILSKNKSLISIPKLKELTSWTGGITLDCETKNQFKEDNNNITFERGDGFFECWSKENILPNTHWLEVMKGEHPQSPLEFSVDISIKRGIKLANKYLNNFS